MSHKAHEFRFTDNVRRGQAGLSKYVELDHGRVADFACRGMTAAEVDFLTIAGCVHYADRAARRDLAKGWPRDLHLEIGVHDVAFWSNCALKRALQDCLQFVTGDCWQFQFTALRAPNSCLSESFLPRAVAVKGTPVVVAYSGGLDSYAGVRLLQRMHPDWHPFLVRARTRSLDGRAVLDLKLPPTARVPLLVDVRLPSSAEEREPSGRTRTFLFLSIAGVAASLLDATQIVICENGQGSIGPSLVHSPWEFPFRATHPGFTRRFGLLLASVSQKPISIEHPFLGQTKGEVLRQFSTTEVKQALGVTNSCVRYPLRHKGVRPAPMCGICGGCLLRRVSLIAAGHADLEQSERYYWKNLSASTISASGTLGPTSDRDKSIAIRAVLDMADLAGLARRNGNAVGVRRVASELAAAGDLAANESRARLLTLLLRHDADWTQFISKLAPDSWIRTLTGAKQDA